MCVNVANVCCRCINVLSTLVFLETPLSTYTFLHQQTIFEEKHEWCNAVLTVVQQSHHALWVHGLSCEKLQGDKCM